MKLQDSKYTDSSLVNAPSTSSTLSCKNCSQAFAGKFCPNCGQLHIENFTWQHLLKNLFQSIEMEKGLLLNLKDLTIKPYHTIKSYLDGKTKNYLNPIAYFLIILALVTIIKSTSDNLMSNGLESSRFLSSDEDVRFINMFMMIFMFFGLSITLNIFNRFTYLENSIIALFTTSQVFLIFNVFFSIPIKYLPIGGFCLSVGFGLSIIHNFLNFTIRGKIWRLSVIFIITAIFTVLGWSVESVMRPYIYSQNVTALKAEYDYKKNINSQLHLGVSDHKKLFSNPEFEKMNKSTYAYLNYIDSLEQILIIVTGGGSTEGDFSALNKQIVNSYMQKINAIDSIISYQNEWYSTLKNCECEFIENDNAVQSISKNLMMIEILMVLEEIKSHIISTEQKCLVDYLVTKQNKPL